MSIGKECLFVGPFLAPLAGWLEPEITVHRWWDLPEREAFLRSKAVAIRAIATDAFTGADRELLAALPKLELIANFGVGYDRVDFEYARSRGIQITNTPGVLDDDVADLTLGLMLSVFRRIALADRFVRNGQWLKGPFPLTQSLRGKHLGIVGLGRIGKKVAARAAGFGLSISYYGRQPQAEQAFPYFPDLEELARRVDVLVVLVPASQGTQGLISRRVLTALAERQGVLINVARGSVVDEDALVELLVDGKLGGAGLDVFADEPRVPQTLLSLDSVVLQPHVGSATVQTREAMGRLVVANLQAFFRGEPLLTPVGY